MTPSSVSSALPTPLTLQGSDAHTLLPHCPSSRPAAPVVAPGEVVETADEVCKFPGQWLSWWQAQESCEQRFGHLVLRHPDAVLAPRLPDPIWVGKREAPLQRPPQRRECGLGPGKWGLGGGGFGDLEMAAHLDSPCGLSPEEVRIASQVPLSWTESRRLTPGHGHWSPISSFQREGGTRSPERALQLRQRAVRSRTVCAARKPEVEARVSPQARAPRPH